jgi:predicted esterase
MRKFLLAILTLVVVARMANAQNVMSHLDGVYTYNSGAAIGTNNNPAVPPPDIISKWVNDPTLKPGRINWPQAQQDRFKCYFFNGMAFRLRFPKNYDPNGTTKYPLILFMHGAGEAAPRIGGVCNTVLNPNRENRDQLFWGAQTFDQRIEDGIWNGFLLFPQQTCAQSAGWDNSMFEPINRVLDTLQKYHKFDQNRVIVMGLSSGGGGNVNYAETYPKRVAAVATSDPAFDNSSAGPLKHIPIWIANGGQDPRPQPTQVHQFLNSVRDLGGDTYQNFYATGGHFSWNQMWSQTDITGGRILDKYWNNAHKAQPLLFYQKDKFCADEPVSAKLGITQGFFAYEWQKNTTGTFVTIPGANSNEYTATELGSYRVRFQPIVDSPWSAWSPNPVLLSLKPCDKDTLFRENFEHYGIAPEYLYFGPAWGYKNYNYFRQSGLFVPGSELLTQDASGRQGGRFLFNHTYRHSSTGGDPDTVRYKVGDQVWRISYPINDIPVQQFTDYLFSFSVANITTNEPLVQIAPYINGNPLTPSNLTPSGQGNSSWTKYTYKWSSGFDNFANLELRNNTVIDTLVASSGNGNNFAIDQISFTKLLSPGGVAGSNLWAKSDKLTGTPANGISNWPNAAGIKHLVQNTQANKPTLSFDDADRINFNPVAKFTAAGTDFLTANGGYSGTTAHTKAHVYVVAKATSPTQTNFFLQENQTNPGTTKVEINLPNSIGNVRWAAGNLGTNNLEVALGADINKPIMWSFSKDDANTASGNKQDIRKNGLVVASNNNSGGFTGNNSTLQLGQFDGNVAEVIYYLDATITPAQQNKIESYLALKYGLTLGGTTVPNPAQNYTSSNSTIIWNANTTYQNDVFGIGRDDASGLNQAISNSMNTGSGTGIGQSAKGNLVVQTTTPLTDNKFLLIGNDAGPLTEQLTDLPAFALGAKRVGREWKVNNTGSVGGVNISFDITGLTVSGGNTLGNYTLLIDNDGDGNYNTGTQTIKNATSITGSKINFSNVTLNHNVIFTFVTLAPAGGPLPATWLSFTVEAQDGTATLNWKTADEINVSNYVIEHSLNGIDYVTVGTVTANNTTGVNAYNFAHSGLTAGTHYYRIRRVDFDGKSGYSVVKTVKIAKGGSNVQIRQNPVTGTTLFLSIASQQSTRAAISIVNAEGKTVLLQNTGVSSGNNNLNINLGVMADGIYLLRVQMGEEVVTQKFVKAH